MPPGVLLCLCGILDSDMTTTRNLLESASLIESPDSGTWKVRLISEGKGSSGIYSAQLLENYKHAFNGPTLSFENHPVGWDGPETRNFTQIVGKVVGETWTDIDDRGKVGVYANWEPDPDSRDRLSRYKENLGLSIYIEGEGHVNEDGDFEVDSFNEHDPYKSVDVVIAAGRGGRFEESALRKMYSARQTENETRSETSGQERKDENMDEAKIKEMIDAAIAPVLSALNAKAEEAAQKDADEKAVAEAVEAYSKSIAAIDEADLLPEQVTSLRAEAMTGADISTKIAEAKALKEAAFKHFQESDKGTEGRVVEGATSHYNAWGN